MERYSERQREIFQKFYEDCKSKKIDPTKSEADRQRALLLAQGNTDLTRIFGEKLDGGHVEAYQIGKQVVAEKAAAKRKAAEAAKAAEQRKIDEQVAAFEKELSQKRGRDKRLFFFQKSMEDMQQEIRDAEQLFHTAAKMWAGMNAIEQQKESSWGTMGGIAAGITGSSAVGAVVAADTMSRNADIRAQNEAIRKKNFEATLPLSDSAISRQRAAEDNLKKIQAGAEKVKLHLIEERPLEEMMSGLIFDNPQIAFTKGNTMVVQVTVDTETEYQVSGVPAVVDGCVIAEIFDGEKSIGEAYLNFPRDGISHGKKTTLRGHCLEAKPGTSYTVLLLPLALWLIEKYSPAPIRYFVGYGANRESKRYNFFDLNRIYTPQNMKLSWTEAKRSPLTWQERIEPRRLEAEKKAEEERKIAELKANEEKAKAEARAKEENRKYLLRGILFLLIGIVFIFLGAAWEMTWFIILAVIEVIIGVVGVGIGLGLLH